MGLTRLLEQSVGVSANKPEVKRRNKCGIISRQTERPLGRWKGNHEVSQSSETVSSFVSITNAVLTGQTVQLFGECSHHDVILHDVCHLILEVLFIEGDQGIGAGVPHLNKRLVMSL